MDIYGPNLTQIILPDNSKYSITHDEKLNKFIPLAIGNILINSIDFVVDKRSVFGEDILSKAIKQLYQEQNGAILTIFIDMPPGTGDAYLTILNDLDINDVVLVAVEDDFCIADLHKTNSLKNLKKLLRDN